MSEIVTGKTVGVLTDVLGLPMASELKCIITCRDTELPFAAFLLPSA